MTKKTEPTAPPRAKPAPAPKTPTAPQDAVSHQDRVDWNDPHGRA